MKNTKESSDLLSQLAGKEVNLVLEIDGQKVSLSNLDKILWPERAGQKAVTKRALISYLAKVSPYLLPHLKDRPLSLESLSGRR